MSEFVQSPRSLSILSANAFGNELVRMKTLVKSSFCRFVAIIASNVRLARVGFHLLVSEQACAVLACLGQSILFACVCVCVCVCC